MVDNIFILAGGAGTRLWPASNKAVPKQFLKVRGGKTLLRLTLERAFGLNLSGEVYIITLKEQMDPVIAECSSLGIERDRIVVIPEPRPRNTAPALAAASGFLKNNGRGRETILVMPADHLITPVENFAADVEKAAGLAEKGLLVTFGIKPGYPATGYGYIETGEGIGAGFRVKKFREKPDRETAESFIERGGFYWNSGMFLFTADTFWKELESGSPDIAEVFKNVGRGEPVKKVNGIATALDTEAVREIYSSSPSDSIDYAVMEKSSNTAVVEASFDWNDIGSWDEMAELGDETGNDVFSADSAGNFVMSDIPVALCGVKDLMVIQKNGALLICRKGSGQLVKEVVEMIKASGREKIL